MGRKKQRSEEQGTNDAVVPRTARKLSPLKRNEVNQLVDKLLKVSTSVPQGANSAKEWQVFSEIHKILEKVIDAETDMRIPICDRTGNVSNLVTWLELHGTVMEGVSIQQFEGYDLGLQADKDFAEGDLVVAVPRKLMLSVETSKLLQLGPLVSKDPMLQHMPNVALSLSLLLEKFSPNSFWAPYISALPEQYTTVLYFTPAELGELKGSPALDSALKQCRNIARQYAYFSKLFQKLNDPASLILKDVFSYDQYRWAASTVMTRQNYVPSSIDSSRMVNALIPLWDLCNHAEGKLSTDFVMERDRSECLAWRNFSCGEQLFIFYGARPNCELLVHNGFVFPGNSHDSFALRLGVSRGDPLYETRSALLSKLSLPVSGEFLLRAGPEPVDPALRAFLRVFNMSAENLEHWLAQENCFDLEHLDCDDVDSELDARTWTFLNARVQLLLRSYPSTLEEDEQLLASRGLTPCKRLAVQQRAAEKRILVATLDYTQSRLSSQHISSKTN